MTEPRVLIESVEFSDYEWDSEANNWTSSSDEEDIKIPAETLPSGYDVEAQGEVLTELQCPLCALILRNPVQLEQCGHCMCSNCLTKWKQHSRHSNFRCPICRVNIKPERVFENKMLHRMAMNLNVLCTNKKKKCNWLGELRDLERHVLEDCSYEIVQCCYESCGKRFQRCYIAFHEESCQHKIFPCEHCQESICAKDKKNHLLICPKLPVQCVNKCHTKIARIKMEAHCKDECPLHVVFCTFQSIGCDFQTERRHMPVHMDESVGMHLRLSVQSNETVKLNMRMQGNLIKELKDNVRVLQKEIRSYRKRMQNLETGRLRVRRRTSSASDSSMEAV